jgi:predicted patatin/cPLA2 family phospholipase
MINTGLVLEGGGMRGVYTAGVLEFFMEQDLYLPYIIGVSAGACNAASYLSRQKGRNKIVNIDYVTHPEYLSYRNLIRKKQLFGMDFIFEEIPNRHVPFDFDTFHQSKEKFVIGTTDCYTGEAVYFEKSEHKDHVLGLLRASSSLPFMAPIVEYQERSLLDGGISDPIPVRQSEREGNKKNIVVLTRNEGYRKSSSKFNWMTRRVYPKYKGLLSAIEKRHQVYNETIDYIEERNMENIFVIRPSKPLEVGRVEKNPVKLTNLYQQGYVDAKQIFNELQTWLTK